MKDKTEYEQVSDKSTLTIIFIITHQVLDIYISLLPTEVCK